MGDKDLFMNGIIIAAGVYLIFSAIRMKMKKQVGKSMLSRNLDWEKAPDKEGYIKLMAPVNLVMGIIMLIVGTILTLHEKLSLSTTGESIVIFIAFAFCLAYAALVMNAQNKYLK